MNSWVTGNINSYFLMYEFISGGANMNSYFLMHEFIPDGVMCEVPPSEERVEVK
jgi:hypothetical protein